MKSTPGPDVILSRINKFIVKWKSHNLNSVFLWTSKTDKAISNLIVHVKKGCLSGLLPSDSTSPNESIHGRLHRVFPRTDVGVVLAYGITTSWAHRYNASGS